MTTRNERTDLLSSEILLKWIQVELDEIFVEENEREREKPMNNIQSTLLIDLSQAENDRQ